MDELNNELNNALDFGRLADIIEYQHEMIDIYKTIINIIMSLDPETYIEDIQKVIQLFDEKIEELNGDIEEKKRELQ